jgi:hypothetical protein
VHTARYEKEVQALSAADTIAVVLGWVPEDAAGQVRHAMALFLQTDDDLVQAGVPHDAQVTSLVEVA